MSALPFAVCVAWWNPEQREKFLAGWGIRGALPPWLFMQQDSERLGCAITKNKAIDRAVDAGAEVIVVMDDDCLACSSEQYSKEISIGGNMWDGPYMLSRSLEAFVEIHVKCLEPQPVELFKQVTKPASRGTPYLNRTVTMPVAASYGYWRNVGDYDGCAQLVHGATHPMEFDRSPIFGRYFAASGMNMAFRREWWPICQFINVSRWDDIWAGFLFQKIAYARGFCFNMGGPDVFHSRQSNVWANLRDEALHIEANDTLWRKIHECPSTDYDTLRKLLPV